MPSPIPVPGPLTPVEPNTMLGIGGGATNRTSAQVLRQHLNKLFKGKGWDSLIAALATGLDYNKQLLLDALEQLFLSRASAKYLTQRGSDVGVVRPSFKINMSDDAFRKFAIKTTASKITYQTIDNILEAFYSFIDTKANVLNTNPSPYALSGGEVLSLIVDQTPVTVTFESDDFMVPGAATGVEVAAAITRALNLNANLGICVPERNVVTSVDYLRIIDTTIGLKGSINVVGGSANAILGFPLGITNLHNNSNAAFAMRAGDGLDVILPVTSAAISRNLDNGSYLHGNATIAIDNIIKDWTDVFSVTTTVPHSLQIGEYFYIDGSVMQKLPNNTTVSTYSEFGVNFLYSSSIIMDDGRGLIANPIGTTDVWILDFRNTAFAQAGSTANEHRKGAFIRLNENEYLLIGGATASCEIYHLDSDTWTSVADAPITLYIPLAFMLPSGKILVTSNGLGFAQVETFLYDPVADTWSSTNLSNYNYDGNCVCRLPNNWVMAHGSSIHSHTELYNPYIDRWTIVGDATNPRVSGALCYHPGVADEWTTGRPANSECVYRIGGFNGAAVTTDLERFDLTTGLWTDLGNTVIWPATAEASAILMPDNNILLISGNGVLTNQIFDPTANVSTVTQPLPAAVGFPQLFPLSQMPFYTNAINWEWKFLVTGGSNLYLYDHEKSNVMSCGGFNGGPFKIALVGPTGLLVTSPTDYHAGIALALGGTVTPCAPNSSYLGPYLYEPNSGLAITGVSSYVDADFAHTNILSINDATDFPDGPAYVVFEFGRSNQIGPVKYTLKLSNTSLLMDNSFNRNLMTGTSISLLAQHSPWNPPLSVYATWLTASTEGSIYAIAALDEAVAAGVTINKLVKYPGDRGLGNEGMLTGSKISDKYVVWGGD